MQVVRNCKGEHTGKGSYKPDDHELFGVIIEECPISAVDDEAVSVVNLINQCEGGGFGGGSMLPSILIQETNFYFTARQIINVEKSRIEKFKDEKNKDKNG